jgi:hypothetical protein
MAGPGLDAAVPNVARMYDYWLGGKDNFAADREAADKIAKVFPDSVRTCRDNRAFLQRSVRYLAGQGVSQFVDIGSGLPTARNTHDVARDADPGARVAYVDYDPVVISHAAPLLADNRNVIAIQHDLHAPEELIGDKALRKLIDFRQPVAVLLVAVLHFSPDDRHPHENVQVLKDAMPPGSYLVLTHVTPDDVSPEARATARDVYTGASAPIIARSRAEITRFFDGLELVEPGVVNVNSWHPEIPPSLPAGSLSPASTYIYCGVGKKQ